jgi:nitrite reductase/ring-hydroxylating ferredoxin subunit
MSKRLHIESDTCSGCTSRREFLESTLTGVVVAGVAVLVSDDRLSIGTARVLAAQADERKYPVPAADGVTIDRDNQVILARFQGAVYAFNLACPHEHTALRWRDGDGRFQCPRHSSKYKPDGTFISGRATRNMDRFAIRQEGSAIVVDLSRLFESDKQAADWAAAMVRL